MARMRALMEKSGSGDQFSYGGKAGEVSMIRAARHVRAKIEADVEARRLAALEPETFWTAPFWQSASMRVLTQVLGGSGGGGGKGGAMQGGPRNENSCSSSRFDPAHR